MVKRWILLIAVSILFSNAAFAQEVFAPLNTEYYHLIDREEILNKTFTPFVHTSFKPYKRSAIVKTMDSIGSNVNNKSYILNDNWFFHEETPDSRKPFAKWFYQTKTDLYHIKQDNFKLKVNPVLYLSAGQDDKSSSTPFINTRGLDVRGSLDDKIGYYVFVGENQAVFPRYVQDRISSLGYVPNEAFWKRYGDEGVDFFTARGYVTLNATKNILIQFGHDKNFIGNGYRSLLLSDFSAPSTFLKFQTNLWRFQYTNLYTELIADAPFQPNFGSDGIGVFPKKFMTSHHLSLNITDNFNLGVFESVIFHRGDSSQSAFEWNYLNPMIFYRSIEQYTGSPDNALFGIDFKWNIFSGLQLYGQLMLDEFLLSELQSDNGWWGNKYAMQLGAKYVNLLGVDNLDLQIEHNRARPFTYAHETNFTNYAHYRQPLAHPIGANFTEWVVIGRYQPIKYLFLSAKLIMAKYGADPDGENLGNDIFKDYTTYSMEYGNEIGQGIGQDLVYVDLMASYMIRHNLFLDLRYVYRNLDSQETNTNLTTSFPSIALRLNIASRDYSF